ncbi:MAG TPA: winged helix-turn-helix domain-containing protein [Caldilineaceae bacterium]|nr:winged helix-turn-helix domain-containing protein [Caldilineaceae bacterium]
MANPTTDLTKPARAQRDSAPEAGAALPAPFRLLFLGRKPVAALLAQFIEAASSSGLRWEMVALTSQKAALPALRLASPKLLLVEENGRPESRARFCQTARNRLPAIAIFSVGKYAPQQPGLFDGHLRLPFVKEEVMALLDRIHVPQTTHWLQRGPLRLDLATRTVFTPNGQHHLTPKQCALLQMLMAHSDRVVSRSEIMQAIWNTSYMADTRTLDVHIRWLRECIEPDPSNPVYLLTVRGQGYQLRLP